MQNNGVGTPFEGVLDHLVTCCFGGPGRSQGGPFTLLLGAAVADGPLSLCSFLSGVGLQKSELGMRNNGLLGAPCLGDP